MLRLPLAQWDPSLFTELQELLTLVATQPTTSLVRKLNQKLDEARPWILALTGLPGPNEEDKKFIASSPISAPNGVEVPVKDELLATTNTIADNLQISHLLAAVLALHAVQSRRRFPSRSDVEISIYILHEALQALLDVVQELLRLTVGSDAIAGEPWDDLRIWVENLLDEKGVNGYLADGAVDQIDAMQTRLSTLVRTQASGAAMDLLNFRVEAMRTEQNRLAGILQIIAESGLLKSSQVVKMVKWLKKSAKPDAIVAAVYAAFCAATQPLEALDPEDPRVDTVSAYMGHSKFILVVCNIVFGETFTVEPLREAVRLHWSLFYLSAVRHESSLLQTVQLSIDAAERHLQDAVGGNAFQFLAGLVTHLDTKPEDPTMALAERSEPNNNLFVFSQIDQLIYSLATKRHFLRNLRNKEEDVGLRRSQAPIANFQAFLSLVAVVYPNLPPDSAERLWDEVSFTSVVLDNRQVNPSLAFWNMINAISVGPACASKCYEKLKDTRLSWTFLFKFYAHYIEIMPHLFESIKTSRQTAHEPMQDGEIETAQGWTRLLATVVEGSVLARGALLQAKPLPLQQLFEFVNCDIPTDLKATVMDAIAAFVKRRGDSADDDIATRAVEWYERISFADPTLEVRVGSHVPSPIGWIMKMEYTEQEAGSYPLTRAYTKFLAALIPSDKPRINNALRRGATYIIDRVFLQSRRYRDDNEDEKWELTDAVIGFFEQALLSFDLTDLLTLARGTALSLADQPGFLVLIRMLTQSQVFTPLTAIVDLTTSMSVRSPVINQCLLRVLRIYYRIFDVQLVFNDVLLVALQSNGFKRPIGLQSIDQYLLNHLSNVIAIALAVGDTDLEVSFVSLKIVTALAQSAVFSGTDIFRGEYTKAMNRLAGIIDASDESIRIAQAFCLRLESGGEDLAPEEVEKESQAVLNGKSSDNLAILIRSGILDLLVNGTLDATSPNIAHFLLGFDFRAQELGLQDPRSPTSRLSCLSVILEQLRGSPPLITLHPVLASKSAQLLYQLFAHPVTGPPVMSYAESYAAFPAGQLATLPRTCPEVTREVEGMGKVSTYTDSVVTSASTLVAYLEFERYVLASVALQTFAFEGHGPSSEFVSTFLFTDEGDDEDDQRPPLLLDLLSTVDIQFEETDGDAQQNKVLEFYSGFVFDQFKRPDSDWYDLEILSRALRAHRRQLERQGAVIGVSIESMAAEAEYILRRLAIKNRETEIAIAKGSFMESWIELLKISLAMLFHNVPEDRQEGLLFELLDAILDRLSDSLAPGVLNILCEAVLVALTTLVTVLSPVDSTNLPINRLGQTLLKVVDAAVRPGTTENARGNLYAAVSQFLQLVPTSSEKALHNVTVQALSARKDRFVSVLCRDAMDMQDVWKTECFSLLSAIVSLGNRALVAPVTQASYLAQFVRSIKDRELALQQCLSPEPESLHAFWVYETKMAFLIAYAGTPKGAEDLVEVGVFQTLASCAFIAAQPFGDDVLDDVSASQTVHRQHTVLITALQLLVRVLATPTRAGVSHATSFLNAHQEALLVLLRETVVYVTPTGVDESRLIVALLCMVAPKVLEDEQRKGSFNSFHHAVLFLAAKFFDPSWADSVHDAEEQLDAVPSKVLALNQIIIAYLVATTAGLKAGHGQPVFVVGTARPVGSKAIGTAPTLQSAVDLIGSLAEEAHDIGAAYDDVADKLEAGEEVVAKGFEAETVDELQTAFAQRTSAVYSMIEEMLLLVWRHLLYYSKDAGGENVVPDRLSLSFSTANASTAPGATGGKDLQRVQASLRGVLERIDDVDPTGAASKISSDPYHNMLVRRLRELCASAVGE